MDDKNGLNIEELEKVSGGVEVLPNPAGVEKKRIRSVWPRRSQMARIWEPGE